MSFDAWKTSAPEDDGPSYEGGCDVCAGNGAPPCGEDCEIVAYRAEALRKISARYATARCALRWARAYHDEGVGYDQRVVDCVLEVNRRRREIRAIRTAMLVHPDDVLRRALAKDLTDTMPAPADEAAQ